MSWATYNATKWPVPARGGAMENTAAVNATVDILEPSEVDAMRAEVRLAEYCSSLCFLVSVAVSHSSVP